MGRMWNEPDNTHTHKRYYSHRVWLRPETHACRIRLICYHSVLRNSNDEMGPVRMKFKVLVSNELHFPPISLNHGIKSITHFTFIVFHRVNNNLSLTMFYIKKQLKKIKLTEEIIPIYVWKKYEFNSYIWFN